MAMVGAQQASIQCPNCRTPFQTTLFSLVDVGRHPELKNYFLSGRLNVAVCPACGAGGMLATPIIYHDPAKQLFLALVPQELNLKTEEVERFIGDVTRAIMADPGIQGGKGYLLTPKRFISLQTMVDSILEADGVTKEALAAQRRRVDLIGQLADAFETDRETPDSKTFEPLAEQHKGEMDYDFFMVLTALLDAAQRDGQQESIALLSELRSRLIAISGFDAAGAGLEDPDQGELLSQLIDAPEAQLEELIAENRHVLDYGFFQQWAARIEEAEQGGDQATATRLDARRQQVVELAERLDREAQEMFEGAANVLRAVFEAPDAEAALREQRDQIGEAFMLVIDANIAAAERAGQPQVVEQLRNIAQLAVKVVQEALTPEQRLINEMLAAEKDQDARKLLRTNMAMVTPDFVKQVNEMAEQMEQAGRKEQAERLRQISREAAAMLF